MPPPNSPIDSTARTASGAARFVRHGSLLMLLDSRILLSPLAVCLHLRAQDFFV